MKFNVMDVILWLIIGSALVLIIMNPGGFSADVSSVSQFVTKESSILTGSGYVKPR